MTNRFCQATLKKWFLCSPPWFRIQTSAQFWHQLCSSYTRFRIYATSGMTKEKKSIMLRFSRPCLKN